MALVTPEQVKNSLDDLSRTIDNFNTQLKSFKGEELTDLTALSKSIALAEKRMITSVQNMHKTHTLAAEKQTGILQQIESQYDNLKLYYKLAIAAGLILTGLTIGLLIPHQKTPMMNYQAYTQNQKGEWIPQNYYIVPHSKSKLEIQ